MEVLTQEKNQLVQIINESNLEQSESQVLLNKFKDYFEIASDWEKKINSIVIHSEEQKAEMKMLDEARKFLKSKRLDVEKTRKELKEQSLRKGQTIDSIARILKNLIEPLENLAGEKARFAEIQAEKRRLQLKQEREEKLSPYQGFYYEGTDFGSMDPEEFEMFLNSTILSYKHHLEQIRAEKKAEEERQRKICLAQKREIELRPFYYLINENLDLQEMKEEEFVSLFNTLKEMDSKKKAEAERIRIENEKLRAEAEAKEKARLKELEELRKQQEAAEQKARAEAEARLQKEREERAKIEAELRAKKEAEEKEALRIQAEEKARKSGSDIERLNIFLKELESLSVPTLQELKHIESLIHKNINEIKDAIYNSN